MKKTMMTRINSLVALMILGTAFVACSSDSDRVEQISLQPQPNETYTLSINATKGGSGVTRALTPAGEGASAYISATWATTENIYVKNGGNWCVSSLKPQTAEASTTLKGFIKGTEFKADDELYLYFPKKFDTPDYTGQKGTLEDIEANYDYAKAGPITIESVNGETKVVTLKDYTSATFDNLQAIAKFALKNSSNVDLSATKLVVEVGDTKYTINPDGAASVMYVAIPGFSGQTVKLTATDGSSNTYTYEKPGVTFTNGKYYSIAVKMTMIPEP